MKTLACPKCGHTVKVLAGDAYHDCPKTGPKALPTKYVQIEEPTKCRS